jgi:DNA-binding LacI/PurR family transcriptional regulator
MRFKYIQIAEAAGVSLATVSRVMRGTKGPSERMRERVLKSAQSVGYFPAAFHPKTELILQFHTHQRALPHDPFYGLVFESITARAKALRLRVGLVRPPEEYAPYSIISLGHRSEDELNRLATQRVPVVLVDEDDPRFDRVVSQNEYGGTLAAQHLLQVVPEHLGIAIIAGSPRHYSFPLRTRGAIETLERVGRFNPELVFEPHLQTGHAGLSKAEGEVAAQWLLERKDQIGGVFVGNDLAAVGMMETLIKKGIRIPKDLKVVGHDGENLASPVPLTTVHVDSRAMGWWAVDLALHRLMESQRPPVQIVVGVELLERQSSEKVPVLVRPP